MGGPLGPGSTLGQASGFGTAAFRDNSLSVEDAEFTLDGNGASGALTISVSPKLDITGTLAFGTLDLTPYFSGLSGLMAMTPDWRDVALSTDWFRDMNADIRLSAGSVRLGELTAGDAAASASLRDGRLEIGVARAVFGNGSLAGDLAITDAAAGATVEAQLRASDIAVELPPATIGLPETVSGNATLLLDVGTSGGNLGALVSGLTGTARLAVENGAVPLFGLAEIAGAPSGSTANPLPEEGLASRPVSAASIGLNFSGGLAMLEVGKVVAPAWVADIQGWVGLLDGSLGLNGAIRTAEDAARDDALPPLDATTATEPAEPLRFTIEGTLSQPVARALQPAG
jgi:AsmA protein